MKRSDLTKLIKPIVKECVQEVLFKEGLLSSIVSEVAHGLGNQEVIREVKSSQPRHPPVDNSANISSMKGELKRQRQELLESIGRDSFNGVDIFEGTEPLREQTNQYSPLKDVNPGDAGVDISGIVALGGKNWKTLVG